MTDFHELYSRYAGDIYRFALFLCGNAAEAEDIAAETFARAIAGRAPVAGATAKGYLLAIARNIHLEWARRRPKIGELPPELRDSGSDPEKRFSEGAELDAVRVFLQRIPEPDRAALLLQVNGVAYEEIARLLEISVVSARVKVHRLRLKLAEWRVKREAN
ncbi:MAG: RNA polymerase sigma factor [Wenzhouxiangellaceae bacterium]